MTTYSQLFCTVSDLVADKQAPGLDEARMFEAIKEASDVIQKDLGWFIPVILTRSFNGRGLIRLFVPPLLAVTSIINDANTDNPVTLTTADYILQPDHGFWAHGDSGRIWFACCKRLPYQLPGCIFCVTGNCRGID